MPFYLNLCTSVELQREKFRSVVGTCLLFFTRLIEDAITSMIQNFVKQTILVVSNIRYSCSVDGECKFATIIFSCNGILYKSLISYKCIIIYINVRQSSHKVLLELEE
uniref:Uncharacterized protein n=1 Tax=Cacopsylla melanoneura TaxID=428564 RepID=A0A8D8Q7J1_9HEMI